MSTPALATRALDKNFASLVVARGIEISLPLGARYALIGPNGAGKTTLINLITGMVRPDGGQILLDGDDITGLEPAMRVKRGLVRTFQINTLFPNLSALEAVTLAVCERRGEAGTWWRSLPTYNAAIEEAYRILGEPMLADDCERPTRQLAYGQQRLLEIALALAARPRCCCSTNPRQACPRTRAANCSRRWRALRPTLRSCSSSTIWNWCSGSRRASLSWSRAQSWSRALRRRSPPTSACATSIWAMRTMAEALLTLSDVRAGYGNSIVLDKVTFELPENGSLAVLGRNGVGKSTLFLTIMGYTTFRRGAIVWRGRDITRLTPHRRALLGIGWVAQEREIFPSLTVEENLEVAARPGPWDLARITDLFPRLAERRRNMGNQLSGGEQQMLAIARALMTNPALLLLDEPLEGLAPIIVEELTAAIRRMIEQSGTAIILAEQHAELALSLTQDVLVLERGAIVHRGRSDAMLKDAAALDQFIGLRLTDRVNV